MSDASCSVWPGVCHSWLRGDKPVAVALVVQPQVVAEARFEVDHLGVGKERDVHRVVRVMVAQENVGHGLRHDAECRERIEDQRTGGDHPRVDHDRRVRVPDEHDRAADTLARVAGVEHVDGRHRFDSSRATLARGSVARDGIESAARRRLADCRDA